MKRASFKKSSSETFVRTAAALTSSIRSRRLLNTSSSLYKKLDGYQQEAVAFGVRVKTAAYFFEQGTGKTWIAGGVIDQLLENEPENFQGLLIGPLTNLETTWVAFFREQLPQVTICYCEADFVAAPFPRMMIINYESAARILWWKKTKKIRWSIIVYDEAHRLKDRNSGQSRVSRQLRNSADYKLILTGTPLDKTPSDAWAQFRFLVPEVFGIRWADFEDEFYEPLEDDGVAIDWAKLKRGSMKMQMILRRKIIARSKRKFDMNKLDLFLERIKPYALRVLAEDVLDLKKLTITPVPVELRGVQRLIYEDLAVDSITRLGDHVVTAPLKIVKVWKLHQVCGGYVIDDDGNTHEVGRAKLRRTLHIVATQDKPVVIFCRYVEEVLAIEEELRKTGIKRIEVLYGKNRKKRPEIQRRFQKGGIDVLICQIRSGGIGVDLFRSHVGIIYSMSHSFIDYDQAIKRLQRRGQNQPVEFFILYVPGTVDEAIWDIVSSKGNVTRRILSRLKPERVPWRKTMSPSTASRTWQKTSASMRPTSVRSFARTTSRPARKAATAGTARPRTRKSSRS